MPPASSSGGECPSTWLAFALKLTINNLFKFASTHDLPSVAKLIVAQDVIAVIIVHRLVVIPPQGKCHGLTPALDVSYVHVPLVPWFATPAVRSDAERMRALIANAEQVCSQQFKAYECLSAGAGVISEYLDFGHMAAVDRSPPDSLPVEPDAKPGVAAAAAVQSCLDSELKRAVLLPLYPTFSLSNE
ncbi:hypothetical protein H9P43_009071 [Blastocladiella emersonii ATCC 22665]|nr:hypothetical protein H9P43_009071 [Blastocladiella emersonii ATCC 22665]